MSNNIFKRMSLVPAGLRYKLLIVFCLMSIIPLLVMGYITTNFVFPYVKNFIINISIIVFITTVIAVLGFIVVRRMIEPIIDMALEAKLIAGGDFERSIEVKDEDEIGDLARSLNLMGQKISENLFELKSYGEKTREINEEIQKKVMVLSGLLQVGNLISSGADLKTVLDILVEKVSLVDGSNPALIMVVDKDKDVFLPVTSVNIKDAETAATPLSLQRGLFAKLRADLKEIVIDSRLKREDSDIKAFKEMYAITNAAIMPVIIRGRLEGIIMLANSIQNFVYKDDDIELLQVFGKQAAIAIENDYLMRKTEELEVRDDLTQLYNDKYIRERLDEEIKRAIVYQRPCLFILLSVDSFKDFCDKKGRLAGETALKKIARLLAKEISPVDKAARFTDNQFALILPERSKKEGKKIADELREKIAELVVLASAEPEFQRLTVTGVLTENPIDGVSAQELISKAEALIKEAKVKGKNTIQA